MLLGILIILMMWNITMPLWLAVIGTIIGSIEIFIDICKGALAILKEK